MSPPCHRKMASLSNNLWGCRLQFENPSWIHEPQWLHEDDRWCCMDIPRRDGRENMQWEGFNEKPPTTNSTTTSRSGIHSIENSIATEAKMAALMRRIEMLENKGTPQQFEQVNQTSVPSCFNCQSLTHVMEDCLFIPNPLMNSQGQQLNAAY